MSWKVLAGWSIHHSLMSPAEKFAVWTRFESDWVDFCKWIIDTYRNDALAWAAEHQGKYIPKQSLSSLLCFS